MKKKKRNVYKTNVSKRFVKKMKKKNRKLTTKETEEQTSSSKKKGKANCKEPLVKIIIKEKKRERK